MGDDVILGGLDADSMSGGDGDDIIDGGAGNDFINGGKGFNFIDGGTGTDTVTYAQSDVPFGQNGLFIDLEPSVDPFGNMDGLEAEDDLLVNVENIFGGSGNDFIYGNGLSNTLRGNGGNDTLMGRGNNDVLVGGAGSDRFVFESAGGGGDAIRDYTIGEDKLVFVSTAFSNINAGNIAASFVSNATAAATIAAAQFLFDNTGADAGRLLFDADGTGAGAAFAIATLTFTAPGGAAAFNAGDFLFV